MSVDHPTVQRPDFYTLPNFSGYRFYPDGAILTRWRSGKGYNWRRGEEWISLLGSPDAYGYRRASFRSDDGVTTLFPLHRMLALAFLGPCPPGREVCHADDVKSNNARGNLSYGTRKQNLADAIRNGRKPCGEQSPHAKLTEAQVRDVYRRVASGESQTAVAKDLGVSLLTINAIVRRRRWKHLDLGPALTQVGNRPRSGHYAKYVKGRVKPKPTD